MMRTRLQQIVMFATIAVGASVGLAKPHGGNIKGSVTVKGGSPKGVVVYLESVPGATPSTSSVPASSITPRSCARPSVSEQRSERVSSSKPRGP